MRLNHLDIHVDDVRATVDFLVEHFGLKLSDMRGRAGLAILEDDTGFELVVSPPVEAFGSASQSALGRVTYHIGFNQPDRSDVDRIHAALTKAGVAQVGEPKEMRGGYLFYCMAPGHVLIEVGWRPESA